MKKESKKSKVERPKKSAILATGKEAAARFKAGMGFVLKAGPNPEK